MSTNYSNDKIRPPAVSVSGYSEGMNDFKGGENRLSNSKWLENSSLPRAPGQSFWGPPNGVLGSGPQRDKEKASIPSSLTGNSQYLNSLWVPEGRCRWNEQPQQQNPQLWHSLVTRNLIDFVTKPPRLHPSSSSANLLAQGPRQHWGSCPGLFHHTTPALLPFCTISLVLVT